MPRPQTITDRERGLIEAFTRGEMAGFKYVYTRFRQRVLGYCIYYMGDKMVAEDAFQEVFSRVYVKREQLRDPQALKSWVLLITRSVCLNMLRSSKFTPEFVSTNAENFESFGNTIDTPAEPVQHVIADDMLRVALSRIAPIYRDAFLLSEFEGYSYEEIARITDATEVNVKVRITRAKKQLRILLAPVYKYEAGQSGRKNHARNKEESFPALEDGVEAEEISEEADFETEGIVR
jgi:RNA polymerase sigma-70 factor, ECF subfamily